MKKKVIKKTIMIIIALVAMLAIIWFVRRWFNPAIILALPDWNGHSIRLILFLSAAIGGCLYGIGFCRSLAELDIGRIWAIAKAAGWVAFVVYCVVPYPTDGLISFAAGVVWVGVVSATFFIAGFVGIVAWDIYGSFLKISSQDEPPPKEPTWSPPPR